MDRIPDSWPPDEQTGATNIAPMFPLPGVFLFPGQLMPLHVFEPRYRQMIEDSLDGPGRIVIGTVLEQHRCGLPESPPVVPIAGVGEIARHERTEDGRFVIWLCGLARVRIQELPCDRLYRRVRYDPLLDVPAPVEDEAELRPAVLEAIQQHAGTGFAAGEGVPFGALVDVLAQCLTLPEAVMVGIHGETDVAERARKTLAAHVRFPHRRK